jgi:hypothetical protein
VNKIEKKMPLIIDPPSGWMYGFPKPVPDDILCDNALFRAWLVQQGYPAQDVELAVKHSRYWEAQTRG